MSKRNCQPDHIIGMAMINLWSLACAAVSCQVRGASQPVRQPSDVQLLPVVYPWGGLQSNTI